MGQLQCVNCGKWVADHLSQCPYCREPLPEIPVLRAQAYAGAQGGQVIRRGLLFMLLAAVFYYFAGGYSPLQFPLAVARPLTDYLLPLLFLGGLGLMILGFFRRYAA